MDTDETLQALWRAVKRAAMDFAYEHDLDVSVDSETREVTIQVERGRYLTGSEPLTVKVGRAWEAET